MPNIKKLKEEYEKLRKERLGKGKFMLKPTEKGYWGISALDDVHELFTKLNLKKSRNFIDLGSGDGRVVLAAALFTKATGIECDQELMQISTNIKRKTKTPATFICDDFMTLDISKFDTIFIHPDADFKKLEAKLLMEMDKKAKLIVYNNIYSPETLKLDKELNINGMPVRVFRK